MESRVPLGYGRPDESESLYATTAVPSGLPSFDLPMAILPQYSPGRRMEAEFIYNPIEGYAEDDDRPAIAFGRITKILGYEPREGTHLTRIVVRLLFRSGHKTRVCLRVKMGNIPIFTEIEGVLPVDGMGGEWRLHLIAPDPRELDIVGLEVPLIVQTLDVQKAIIIDDVCIGTFKFWNLTSTEVPQASGPGYFDSEAQEHDPNEYLTSHPHFSRDAPLGDGSSPNQVGEDPPSTSYPRENPTSVLGLANMTEASSDGSFERHTNLAIEVPPHNAVDNSRAEEDHDVESPSTAQSAPTQKSGEDTYQVSLRFLGDMESMTNDWTPQELGNQRRIVEFFCIRTRGCIDVTFAPIPVENARDTSKNVVSCIWWKDAEEFVITSVDTINLLERLVGTRFTTEEKNRIRRNLQGFKPSTISKNSPESEPFFRTLMEFPPPRPRNIEKDVKAFKWSKLPFMLEKVISKYWFVSSPSTSEADESSPRIRVLREIDTASTESPGMPFQSLSASHTPTSGPSSQLEVEHIRVGTLESGSYMPTPSPSQGYHDEYHSGLSAHDYHHLGYPQSSQSSADSTYGRPEAFMEISDSMEGLRSIPVGGNRVSSQYERMDTLAYPQVVEVHNQGDTYLHGSNVNEVASEDMHSMQYMAHTSHGYA